MGDRANSARTWYAAILGLGGAWLVARGLAPPSSLLLFVAGLAGVFAAVGLWRRRPWGRAVAVGFALSLVLLLPTLRVLRGEELGWVRGIALLLMLWAIVDLLRLEVTPEQELQAVERQHQQLLLELRRRKARALHVLDQAEALLLDKGPAMVEAARVDHTEALHPGLWEHCEERGCAEVRLLRERVEELRRRVADG